MVLQQSTKQDLQLNRLYDTFITIVIAHNTSTKHMCEHAAAYRFLQSGPQLENLADEQLRNVPRACNCQASVLNMCYVQR